MSLGSHEYYWTRLNTEEGVESLIKQLEMNWNELYFLKIKFMVELYLWGNPSTISVYIKVKFISTVNLKVAKAGKQNCFTEPEN